MEGDFNMKEAIYLPSEHVTDVESEHSVGLDETWNNRMLHRCCPLIRTKQRFEARRRKSY
jgi:hypothetical protein